jgi:uncharacterized protein
MVKASREFQVFAKPVGATCNLGCSYCYYLEKKSLYPDIESFRMSDDILEEYIRQHIEASPGPEVSFSWHGGEPTILGLEYFRKILLLQNKYKRTGYIIKNGMQTNGTLLDEEWCGFLADNNFAVGLSLDGPAEMHNRYRVTKSGKPTHDQVMRGYEMLRRHGVHCDVLCVVNAYNVQRPDEVYEFFRNIGARYLSFLPLVERQADRESGVSAESVSAQDWGDFLCTVFDIWKQHDIGRIKVQIFEEATQPALGREHRLCIFRETCGDIPVVENNGDFYSCDHFVDPGHCLGNIMATPLVELLESREQLAFGKSKRDTLPQYCLECGVVEMCHGECPKNRFIQTPDGEPGLNYLCAGYKRFFDHCGPFVSELGALWQRRSIEQQTSLDNATIKRSTPKIGRNDPCPCGSGRKYKKCCLGK